MQKTNTNIKMQKILLYLSVYFILLFKAGFYFIGSANMLTAPFLLVFLVFVAFSKGKGSLKINKQCVLVVIILFALINITNLLYGFPEFNEYIMMIINLVTALLCVGIFKENEYYKGYCDVIFAISVASIVAWILIQFGTGFFSIFPQLINSAQRAGWFAVLTTVSEFSDVGTQRTQGIFWEPGAFQCLIIVAMLLEKYQYKPQKALLRRIIYSITVVITFSTTGYLALILVWMLLLPKDSKHFSLIKVAMLLSFCVIVFLEFGEKLSGQLYYTLVSKINGVLNFKESTNYSVTARTGSVIEPIKYLIRNPIFGIGEAGYKEVIDKVGMATCTPVNYLCKYGLIFASICFYGFARVIRKPGLKYSEYLFIIVTLCVAFISETYFMNPILTIFILYGYKRNNPMNRRIIAKGRKSNEY